MSHKAHFQFVSFTKAAGWSSTDIHVAPEGLPPLGYEVTGPSTNNSLREELRGQPKIKGWYGPMWGGHTLEGEPIVRYESARAYTILSS